MATMRERLHLLKASRKSRLIQLQSSALIPNASSKEEKRTPTATPTKRATKRSPVDWRVKARKTANQRRMEALEESPVYSIISRKVEPERNDTLQNVAEQEEEEGEDDNGDQQHPEMGAEIDDEEEALERAVEEEAEEEEEDVQGDGNGEGGVEENEDAVQQPAEAEPVEEIQQETKPFASTDQSPSSPSKSAIPSAPVINTTTPIMLEETSPHLVTPPRNRSSEPPSDEPQSPEALPKPPMLRRHTSTSNLMIEDEASDDEKNPDTQQPPDNDLNDTPVEGIVEDADVTPQKPGEGLRLANFHRQWQMEKQNVHSKPALSKDEQDMAEAVNLTEQLRKEEQALSRDAVSVAASADFDAKTDDLKREATEKYIDQMFVRHDTRSRVVEEDVELTEEEKLKARALWKTRKRLKMQMEMEDENSLSRLDLFKDIDENRSTELRLKLESATRQPAKQDESEQPKRRFAWANQQPEWIKRRRVLEEKQRRRASSVSVSEWTFDKVSEKKKKQSTKSRSNSSNRPLTLSLGPTHASRRKHRTVVSEKVHISSAMKPRRQGTSHRRSSIRGILGILGKQATAEKS